MQVTYWQGPTKEHHHYSKNGFGRKQRNKKHGFFIMTLTFGENKNKGVNNIFIFHLLFCIHIY